MSNKPDCFMHGEVILKRKKMSIPKGAKRVEAKNGQYKIADSENTGNFHLLEAVEGVELYEKDGVLYAKTSVEANVTCVDKSRHDTITLEPTKEDEVLVIERAKEYDFLKDEIRSLAD